MSVSVSVAWGSLTQCVYTCMCICICICICICMCMLMCMCACVGSACVCTLSKVDTRLHLHNPIPSVRMRTRAYLHPPLCMYAHVRATRNVVFQAGNAARVLEFFLFFFVFLFYRGRDIGGRQHVASPSFADLGHSDSSAPPCRQ